MTKPGNPVKAIVIWSLVIFFCIGGFIYFSLEGVPEGYRGLVVAKSNDSVIRILEPGLHFVWPFGRNVFDVDMRMKNDSYSVVAKTKDKEEIYVTIGIKRSINPNYYELYYQRYVSMESAEIIYHDVWFKISNATERVFRNYDFNLLSDPQIKEEIENKILKLTNEEFECAMVFVDTKHEDAKVVQVLDTAEANISRAIYSDTREIFGERKEAYVLETIGSSYEKFFVFDNIVIINAAEITKIELYDELRNKTGIED